jgi:Phosphate-starvation-inducible E family
MAGVDGLSAVRARRPLHADVPDGVIIGPAVWNELVLAGGFDPTDQEVFQAVFGMIFTVLIALEFKRSLVVVAESRNSIVQVRTVVLLAMLAIVRKLIILDLKRTEAAELFGLAAAIEGAAAWCSARRLVVPRPPPNTCSLPHTHSGGVSWASTCSRPLIRPPAQRDS